MSDAEQIRELLADGECFVTFTKVNGERREMNCTLKSDLIPADKQAGGKIQLNEETRESVVRVFDLEAQGWRSFRVNSVTFIELV